MFDQVFQNLATTGPLAAILGAAVIVLWRRLNEEIARNATVEENLRKEFAAHLKAENDRHAAEEDLLRKEALSILKRLTGALRGDNEQPS